MNPIVKSFQYGQHTVTLETGVMARQATAAVMVSMDDTCVFVTVVGKKEADHGRDFFPLTVNYQERTYAAGRIPGGFFRREGRPSEGETLISRLIDRPIRPLFPEGFLNEVQVVATVMSVNPAVSPDIVAMIGASAALAISGIPFGGPIAAARVGYMNGQYVLNPTTTELPQSDLDLVVAGTANAVLMVESEAAILSEEVMLGAVVFGHEQMQAVINAINEFAADVGTKPWNWDDMTFDQQVDAKVLQDSEGPRRRKSRSKREKRELADLIKAAVGLAGPYDFLPIENRDVRPVFFFPDSPPESQPINHVTAGAPPSLLIASTDDDLVNPARNTGGLADTIENGVTGFLFNESTVESYEEALSRAFRVFANKGLLNAMRSRAMTQPFNWCQAVEPYAELYEQLVAKALGKSTK